jgi:hypothetical protein
MYARSTTMFGNPQAMDDAITCVRDEVLPALQRMPGCTGLSMLYERCSGRSIATSAWESEEAMRASAEPVHPLRERLVQVFGGQPEVQEWEIAVLHREHATGDGAAARVTWLRCDPEHLDRLLDGYRISAMPRLQTLAGFCGLSMLADRPTGRAVDVTTFTSREGVTWSRKMARCLREQFAQAMGAKIEDVAEMDLALAHLRVPETV